MAILACPCQMSKLVRQTISVLHWSVLHLCLLREVCDLGPSSFFIKSSVIVIFLFISFINSCFLCAAACCTLWVSPHHGQQASDKLRGWYQANTHSHYLHLPAHLEHSALHPAACRLAGQTEPTAGHLTCEFDLDFFLFVCLLFVYQWCLICACVCVLFYARPTSICVCLTWFMWRLTCNFMLLKSVIRHLLVIKWYLCSKKNWDVWVVA